MNLTIGNTPEEREALSAQVLKEVAELKNCPFTPQPGDWIVYHGRNDAQVGGFIAERRISPLTGNPRYRVVDSMQDAKDEEAGHWVSLEHTIAVYESRPVA